MNFEKQTFGINVDEIILVPKRVNIGLSQKTKLKNTLVEPTRDIDTGSVGGI